MEGVQGTAWAVGHAHVLMRKGLQGQGDEHKAMWERWGEEHGWGGRLHADMPGTRRHTLTSEAGGPCQLSKLQQLHNAGLVRTIP